ncbi:DNA translocase FtsK [Phycisphaerae bacterium RAS1]|nr:DNA translocase FtsK [Phycisphaerae bacterium RAS1]
MARTDERQAALRFCLSFVAALVCLFIWICVLSYDIADPPSNSVWPANDPAKNLCGVVGATLAHHLLFYLGIGSYAFLFLVSVLIWAWGKGVNLTDMGLRAVGLAMVTTAVAAAGAMLIGASDRYPMSGPGGVLGAAAGATLQHYLRWGGTLMFLLCAVVVGAVLAADEIVLHLLRAIGWLGRRSMPMIVRGSEVVVNAGSAVANAGAAVASAGAAAAMSGVVALKGRTPALEPPKASRHEPSRPAPRAPTRDEREQLRRARDEEIEAEDDRAADRDRLAPTPARERFAPPAPRADDAASAADDAPDESHDGGAAAVDQPGGADADRGLPLLTTPKSNGAARGSSGPVVREMRGDDEAARGAPKSPPPKAPLRTVQGDYILPPLALLEDATPIDKSAIEILCREKAFILEQTLNEFRLEVQVVAIDTGPVITVFELKLAPGIKVSQIASLTNDMARALKAPAVRVVAPLPGKNTIGIEVPNLDKEKVRLKDIIHNFGQRADGMGLPLYLGKDASGQPLVSDLTRMPHCLIAGTTGSGKSVCVSSVIMSILLTRSPDECKLIMVDPKVVELAMYRDVPHLMCPIVTEMSKAEGILDWAATKMDERYALLAEAGVKDIRGYNRLGYNELKTRLQIDTDEEMTRIQVTLPYIVIVIDELADMMMTSAKEVEFYLCRLAQKSRAVGIHLIVSTQRPQANVVTGLIKSNLPSRICFRVASRLDSRIVLDQNGGEVLMGQGDMLFLPPGMSKLVRSQGTFISDEELKAVVRHCKEQRQPEFHPELIRAPGKAGSDGERDELFDEAVDMIIQSGRGSVSLLQRRLTVGYGRASRLIDQMYAAGIVGEYKGSQAREVIVTKEEWEAIRGQRDREEAAEAADEAS